MLKKTKTKKSLFLVLLFGAILFHNDAIAASQSIQVEQNVSNCDNDGICDSWEIYSSCPNDCPAPPPPEEPAVEAEPQTQSAVITINSTVPEISGIKIEPDVNSVKILWKTAENSVSQIYWGKTQDYEEGSLSEISFLKNHAIKIENLLPSSKYFFKIIIFNAAGNKKEISGLSFKTLAPPDTEAPANVKNLQARFLEDKISLTWDNPTEDDFEAVRITKREGFYPRDPLEGKVVYEGGGTRAEDKEIEKGTRYYYSVFSRDKNWNYSSGAIISVLAGEKQKENPASETERDNILEKETPKKERSAKARREREEKTSEKKEVPRKETIKEKESSGKETIKEKSPAEQKTLNFLKKITLFDFNFIQNGKKISFTGNQIKIEADKNLKISIEAKKIPQNVKSLLAKLKDTEYPYETFSFIFKLNKDEGVFDAVIAPLGKKGSYPLSIHFINRKNKEFKKINAEIISTAAQPKEVKGFFENFAKKFSREIILFLIAPFLIVAALWKKLKGWI